LLDFRQEPSDDDAKQIVKFCRLFTPELLARKILFERDVDDPWLHGNMLEIYDIETALAFTDQQRIQIPSMICLYCYCLCCF
jgi:hypothetical protein